MGDQHPTFLTSYNLTAGFLGIRSLGRIEPMAIAAPMMAVAALLLQPAGWLHASRRVAMHHVRLPPNSVRCAAAPEEPEDDQLARAVAAEMALFETSTEALMAAGETTWALLFNSGGGNQGIYSRRVGNRDLVVVFEDLEDAERYATMLEATDFLSATPERASMQALLDFCEEGGHTLGLVRRGVVVIPPDNAVDEFQWQPGLSEEGLRLERSADPVVEEQRGALERMFQSDDPEDAGGAGR